MRGAALAVIALGIATVNADKWSDLKTQSTVDGKLQSYLDKKKRHRNLEDSKTESDVFKKKDLYEKSSKKKYESTTEKFLKDEKWQLCQSVDEADVKNTLLKFGLVTHLFEDAQKFRKSMKTLQELIPNISKKKNKNKQPGMKEDKKMIREKGAGLVKLTQTNWVGPGQLGGQLGRALGYLPALADQVGYASRPLDFSKDETNTIWGGRERRRRDTLHSKSKSKSSLRGRRKGTLKVPGQVPQCYGWKYLKALDVLSDTDEVAAEVLAESVSDMLDTEFSKAVSHILETCGDRLAAGGTDLCPPPETPEEGEPQCPSQCLVNEECQFREICCKVSCGGSVCLSTVSPGQGSPCQAADQYMQCVYQMIDTQLCSPEQ